VNGKSKVEVMTSDDLQGMSRDERIVFYRKQIQRYMPPKNAKQKTLLKVYQQLLEAAGDDEHGAAAFGEH